MHTLNGAQCQEASASMLFWEWSCNSQDSHCPRARGDLVLSFHEYTCCNLALLSLITLRASSSHGSISGSLTGQNRATLSTLKRGWHDEQPINCQELSGMGGRHGRTAVSRHLEAPAPLTGLNEQQHARAARVAHVHHPVEVGVPPAGAPPHPGEVGRLVVNRELQDAQPLHTSSTPVRPFPSLISTIQQQMMEN